MSPTRVERCCLTGWPSRAGARPDLRREVVSVLGSKIDAVLPAAVGLVVESVTVQEVAGLVVDADAHVLALSVNRKHVIEVATIENDFKFSTIFAHVISGASSSAENAWVRCENVAVQ